MKLTQYQTLVFDCDGVVLNSNKVKTEAFYEAALSYGEAAAQKLVEYHLARGGISRYAKFEWFFQNVAIEISGPNLEQLLEIYAAKVRQGLQTCEIAEGLTELREKTKHANWLIVSGGDQQELRDVFVKRDLVSLFNGGIFGSPDDKDKILVRELKKGNISQSAIFLGDSRYDYQAATNNGLDFVFLSQWSELTNWAEFCEENKIVSYKNISKFLNNNFYAP
ncbi:MAG: HAD hydrolase-like protein [Alishewanella agri]|nr:HAD hydrolase-like protein [Alishewanella agri]